MGQGPTVFQLPRIGVDRVRRQAAAGRPEFVQLEVCLLTPPRGFLYPNHVISLLLSVRLGQAAPCRRLLTIRTKNCLFRRASRFLITSNLFSSGSAWTNSAMYVKLLAIPTRVGIAT